jgi:hypothetical protein
VVRGGCVAVGCGAAADRDLFRSDGDGRPCGARSRMEVHGLELEEVIVWREW